MKKILLIMMCSFLVFACNKNEKKEVAVNKIVDSDKTKIEKSEKPKPAKGKAKKSTTEKTEPKVDKEVKKTLKGINPEIKSITVGNDEMGFIYTEDLSKDEEQNKCPSVKRNKFDMSMKVYKIKNGEGEYVVDDSSFLEMEEAIFSNKKLPEYNLSTSQRLLNIDGYRFIEYITLAEHDLISIQLQIILCTTTPTNKIIISFYGNITDLATTLIKEAPMYFHESSITSSEEIEGWGNKVPEWNAGISDDPEYHNMKNFCKKLIAGTCESKTAQTIFNTYQEFIKSMKIE